MWSDNDTDGRLVAIDKKITRETPILTDVSCITGEAPILTDVSWIEVKSHLTMPRVLTEALDIPDIEIGHLNRFSESAWTQDSVIAETWEPGTTTARHRRITPEAFRIKIWAVPNSTRDSSEVSQLILQVRVCEVKTAEGISETGEAMLGVTEALVDGELYVVICTNGSV